MLRWGARARRVMLQSRKSNCEEGAVLDLANSHHATIFTVRHA